MDILLLNEREVEHLLDPDALLDALAEGFRTLSSGLVEAPKRIGVSVPTTGFLLAMPAYQQGRQVTVKLVIVFHQNQRLGIPTHQALICLFDPETGTAVSVMGGTSITALRTAGRPPSQPGCWHAPIPVCWRLSGLGYRAMHI
jgi:ornithine cyclodeaminase/alanine dehydrogenase-like protein (mu-crystallin family)